MSLIPIAAKLADFHHKDQLYGGYPYYKHLNDVRVILSEFDFGDNEVLICAAYLHDILEDTKATIEDLRAVGITDEIIDVVMAVTDEPGENREKRKTKTYLKIAQSRRATIVKLADRIANIRFGILNNNKDKFEMYKKEYLKFRLALYNADFELNNMWDELDKLMDKTFEQNVKDNELILAMD